MVEIEKGVRRKGKGGIDFDNMELGSSFIYSGPRSSAVIKFAYRLARGKYRTEPTGDGRWRFYLIKDVKPLLDD